MAKENKPNEEYIALKRAVADNALGNVYVLYGAETYLREHYFGQMKKLLLANGPEAFNYKYFAGKNVDPDELAAAVDMLPVFADRTLVEVRDFDFFRAAEDIRDKTENVIQNLPDYCCLVFYYTDLEFKPVATTSVYRFLKKKHALVEFEYQQQTDLMIWMTRRFRALGKDISKADEEFMIFYCGESMSVLITEIEKVGAYASGPKVTRADIRAIATPEISARVFDMTDAIGRKDFNKSAAIMSDMLLLRENPIKLLSIIGAQLRRLYWARLCLDAGQGVERLKTMGNIKDYPARRLLEDARRFSSAWCAEAVKLAAEADFSMKSDADDDEELLKLMLLKLAVL